MEQKIVKVTDENTELNSRIDKLLKENERLSEEVGKLRTMEFDFNKMKFKVDRVANDFGTMDTTMRGLMKQINNCETNSQTVKCVEEMKNKVDTLANDLGNMEATIVDVRRETLNTTTQIANKVDTLANDLGTMEATIMDVRRETLNTTTQIENNFQTNLTNVNEMVKDVQDDIGSLSESMKTFDANSSTKSENSTQSLESNLQKHDELEYQELCDNKKNGQNLFLRINAFVNSDFPKSEVTRIFKTWTNNELASAFNASVATIRPLKVEEQSSLFIVKLKKKQAKSFKSLLHKFRRQLIDSPIMARNDLNAITRLKKSVLGLIAKKLRIEHGKKTACQKRFDKMAKLHYQDPENEEIVVLNYKDAVLRFKNFITEEESQEAYGRLEKSMPDSMKKAILLL